MSHEQSKIQILNLLGKNWQKTSVLVEQAGVVLSDPEISGYWPLKRIAEVHDL
jgi:hypothetical protein